MCHKPVDDLVDHAVAAKGDNGAIALSLCGQLLGVSHTLGQYQVKLGCACSHVQKALQALGNFARRTRLGGWVGDDERATKISCVHGRLPAYGVTVRSRSGRIAPRLWLHGEYLRLLYQVVVALDSIRYRTALIHYKRTALG